jgi:hypothetical protein
MAGELLAPVLDEHTLAARDHPSTGRVGGQPGEPAADDATLAGGAGRVGTAVIPPGRRAAGPEDVVVGVQDIHIGPGRELRVDRQPEHPPVPEVVHRRGETGAEHGRSGVRDAVEHLDLAALLADEHLAVGSELDVHRVGQAAPDGLIGEVLRQGRRLRGRGG